MQEDTLPEMCGGQHVGCLAKFVMREETNVVPEKRGSGSPKGSTLRTSVSSGGAVDAENSESEGIGEGEGAKVWKGRGRAADYWKEQHHGVCLFLVLLHEDIYLLFISKDLRLGKNQLETKE
eukprot:2322363-Rhodomonas_salina.2